MNLLVYLGLLMTTVALSKGKTFTKCGLVRELKKQGFPETKLRDWVCLVTNESGMHTEVIGHVNRDGSRDHGLFQINDRYWCSNSGIPGKDCQDTCADLRTDDITRASKCAKLIYQRHNFNAWYGWINHCKGKPLPDISDC